MKTVNEVVSEWTREERERFKDLIQECQEREERLIENSKACKQNLIQLNDSLTSLFSQSHEIKQKTEKLADDLLRIYMRLYKNKLPPS
jgi:hypothetical protein